MYESNGTIGVATGTGSVPSSFASNATITNALNNQIPNGGGCGVYINSGNLFVQIGQTAGHTIKLVAAKLEVGSTQTLAHKENGIWVLNEIPNFEDQLMRCAISKSPNADNMSGGRPVAGFVAGSGFPYLRYINDNGYIYQWVITGSGTTQNPYKLAIQKYDGSTWSNLVVFTAD